MSESPTYNVLVVEDNPGDADLTNERLSDVPGYVFRPAHATTLRQALDLLAQAKYDAAIIDLSLPDSDGIATVERIRAASEDLAIVVLSGNESEAVRRTALAAGARDYLCKNDLHSVLLARSVLYAVECSRSEQERRQTLKLVSSNPDAVVVVDLRGVVQFANEAAVALLGRSLAELIGQPFGFDVEAGAMTELWIHAKERDHVAEMHVVSFEWNREPALLASIRDVTESHRLTAMLRQSQKMEAIGRLAGGVAHDFNNLLNVINGYADLLIDDWKGDAESLEALREIRKAGNRAAGLTRQLLMFGRRSIVAPVELHLNALIVEIEKMLVRLIGEDIDFAAILDPNLGAISADHGQIEQVVMNLVINARDAMPTGGKLTIETQNVFLEEAYSDPYAKIGPGRYARLSVSDNGTGMSAETMSRVFEPFFTTKGAGHGTGLGLATVYGIVKQCGGHVTVYSEEGSGSTFKLLFPTAEPGAKAAVEAASKPASEGLCGTEKILLVEDESAVRDFAKKVLERHGYTVYAARDGEDALDAYSRLPGRVDLLLTDVVMPRMAGPQLAEQLLRRQPALRVLFMSGYTDDAVVRHGVLRAPGLLLQKPFTPRALVARIREIFDTDTPPPDSVIGAPPPPA